MTTTNAKAMSDMEGDGLQKLLQSHEYSDFTVQCGDRVWSVHRAILCPRSTYFKKVCSSGFKESTDFKITFVDEDPIMVEHMIAYLYSLKYPQDNRVTSNLAADLLFDAKMYAIAEKYDLSTLKTQVRGAFKKLMERVEDECSRDRLGFMLDSKGLEKSCGEVVAGTARIVYTNTPESDRGLRDIIKDSTYRHKKALMKSKTLQECILNTYGYMDDVVQSLFEDATSSAPSSATDKLPRKKLKTVKLS